MGQNNIKSTCMFCGSTSFGMGCAYSPHKRHVHISNGKTCIYCGSTNVGMGCPYNPFSRLHVRGVEYNNMVKESVHHSVMSAIFLNRLLQPVTAMEAYKLGLIDENGYKIKDPVSENEKASLQPLDQQILKIRRLINEDIIQLFKSNLLLEISSDIDSFDVEKYKKEIILESKIKYTIDNLCDIFSESIECGFSKEYIENKVIESILKKYENN